MIEVVGVHTVLPVERDRPLRRLLRSHAPNVARPDIAERFAEIAGAERSGFRLDFNLLGLPAEAELAVHAAFPGRRSIVGRLRVRRSTLPAHAASLEPVLMHTLGRSGSTWLTKL